MLCLLLSDFARGLSINSCKLRYDFTNLAQILYIKLLENYSASSLRSHIIFL